MNCTRAINLGSLARSYRIPLRSQRRPYATSPPGTGRGNTPWIIGIALATPATYFLLVPSSPSQPPTTYGNEHEPQPPSGIVTRIDDAKGGVKKRIDSHQQTNIGQGASSSGDGGKDHPMKKQQVGLSNTDTRYSYDVGSDPGKSKKGEGTVDTAKIQGPVDPGRRQV